MPKHIAIQQGQLYPQPEYTIQIDQENKWTVTQVYLCHSRSILQVPGDAKPGLAHEEVTFATLANVTAVVGAGELAEITCTYVGAGGCKGCDPMQRKRLPRFLLSDRVGA